MKAKPAFGRLEEVTLSALQRLAGRFSPNHMAQDRERVMPELDAPLPAGRWVRHGHLGNRFSDLQLKRPGPTRRDQTGALEEIFERTPVLPLATRAIGSLIQSPP